MMSVQERLWISVLEMLILLKRCWDFLCARAMSCSMIAVLPAVLGSLPWQTKGPTNWVAGHKRGQACKKKMGPLCAWMTGWTVSRLSARLLKGRVVVSSTSRSCPCECWPYVCRQSKQNKRKSAFGSLPRERVGSFEEVPSNERVGSFW